MALNLSSELREELVSTIRRHMKPLLPLPTDLPERVTPISGIRAVLFDVYGTLLVSKVGDVGVEAETDALLHELIRQEHAKAITRGVKFPEVDICEIWRQWLIRSGYPPADFTTWARMAVDYECRVNNCWPMPHAAETLCALHQQGLALGIVSNAQFYTPLAIEALMGSIPIPSSSCVWSYELREGKPSTKLFEQALKKLGTKPNETLYVGNDMLKDIWPASHVGCKTVLFAGDRRSLRLREDDPRCVGIQPDAIITDLYQLIQIFDARL